MSDWGSVNVMEGDDQISLHPQAQRRHSVLCTSVVIWPGLIKVMQGPKQTKVLWGS